MLSEHPSAKMCAHAIACLSYFVLVGSQSLFVHHDSFIATLFKLASDDDPSMGHVAEYILYFTKDKNENVALEACEFWLTFAEGADLAMHLHPLTLLGKIAPVLLDCMVYGEDDLLWLESGAEDAAVPDKDIDIKLRHYGDGKSHGLEHDPNGNPAPQKTRVDAYGEETIDSDEDNYDLDDKNFADEMSTEWNLRKCAAAALDIFTVRLGGDLLNVLLGLLKEKLWSQDWLQQESGILVLGAMTEGCIKAIELHLTTLPLVRSITCWTLGRYASWTMQPISEEHKNLYFVPTMEGLLQIVLDNNKLVQEAGCSAFATLEENTGVELTPYLEPVLQNLVIAFEKYQHKNMLILYDAVGTLVAAVGHALQNPRYIKILMPLLTNRWSRLKDDDEDLIPRLDSDHHWHFLHRLLCATVS
ncbi:Importin beta-2 subunit [Mycena sanguinolenta]|uniref:Importin beta-2 subunit n=1 Tax=Mycena sanguinolenta TaxID=230812 RepID=A0A8H7CFW3_9AGAR|nr:Importin beta-2 subunit [Mycena sanguinolenta]